MCRQDNVLRHRRRIRSLLGLRHHYRHGQNQKTDAYSKRHRLCLILMHKCSNSPECQSPLIRIFVRNILRHHQHRRHALTYWNRPRRCHTPSCRPHSGPASVPGLSHAPLSAAQCPPTARPVCVRAVAARPHRVRMVCAMHVSRMSIVAGTALHARQQARACRDRTASLAYVAQVPA